jgi:DNA-binding protein HU-beta
VSKATALQVVNLLTDRMKQALLDGNRIEIRGFGVFEPRPRKSGMGRNIKTGITVAIAKGQSIRFKPGKDLRDIEPS